MSVIRHSFCHFKRKFNFRFLIVACRRCSFAIIKRSFNNLSYIFFFKWFYSFYYYFGEDLSAKIIFEQLSDGYLYFVYLESLSNLEFNNSYDPNLKNLANLPIPLSSILFHTILYLFIGNSVFIFLEFICIFIFLFIFYLICKRLNFNDNFSILVPVFLFVLPSLISFFDINYIKYLTVLLLQSLILFYKI